MSTEHTAVFGARLRLVPFLLRSKRRTRWVTALLVTLAFLFPTAPWERDAAAGTVTDSNLGPIELIENTSTVPGSLRVSAGEDGTMAAVWQDPERSTVCCPDPPPGLHAARSGPGGKWSPPVLVNESPITAGPADIVVMANGTALIVWIWLDQPHEAANDLYVNLWARTVDANGTWSPQQLLGNISEHYRAFYYPRSFGPKIVPASEGGYAVFWAYNNGNPSQTHLTKFDAAHGWQGTEAVDVPSPQRESYPPVPFGASHFWKDGHGVFLTTAIDNVSQANDVLAFPYRDGVGFQTPIRLDAIDPGDAFDPQITGDGQGNAFVAWRQYNGAGWGIYGAGMEAQGGWGNATLVAKARWGNLSGPNAVLDEAGRVTVVWRELEGWGHYRGAVIDPSTGTTNLTEIQETGCYDSCMSTSYARLVVDAKGTATAVWLESRALYVARHDVESGWASVVSPEYATTTPEDLRVIARAAHEVVVVWLGAPAYTSDWDADGHPDYGQGYGTDGVRALSLRPQFGALEVEITSPNNGTVTSNASVWVSGHATPGARLVVAGSIVEIATDGTFGVSVNLTLGANTISAEATRAGWLPASDAVTVTRVAAAPVDGSSAAKGGTILAVSPPDVFFLILLLLGFLGALTFVWLQIRRTRDAPNVREPRI